VENLLSFRSEITRQLNKAGHILLLTDYDGTLTPIVDRPELADLPENMKLLLKELTKHPNFTLGIISGRALSDIKNKVGIKNILYAGNHGLEIEGPRINILYPGAALKKQILAILQAALTRAMVKIKGVIVEHKGFSLSVHYRLAEEQSTEEIEKIVKTIVKEAESAGEVIITPGKKVFEIRPAVDWNKGKVIAHLITIFEGKEKCKNTLFPMYFGDDLTDEDGFRVINAYKTGLSVLIGEKTQKSAAHYFLKSPAELEKFLSLLTGQARKGFN
jgi:trehalose 6-phosphate phosphatase